MRDTVGSQVFVKSLVLVVLPVGKVEVVIEHDDGSRLYPIGQGIKNALGAAVDVAIDMDEGEAARVIGFPFGYGVAEPSLVQRDVGRDARQPTLAIEGPGAEVKSGPCLRQALEAVEAMQLPLADELRDETRRAAVERAEFDKGAVKGDLRKRIAQDVGLLLHRQGVRHVALDEIDRSFQGAQCHRSCRVDFRDVAKLTKPAHHRVQESLQVKIGDERFSFP